MPTQTQHFHLSFISLLVMAFLMALCPAQVASPPDKLKVHSIFASNMVIQRGKPILVWGWAAPGKTISVQFGSEKAEAKPSGEKGRWEVTFPAREASAEPQTLVVSSGEEKVEMANIVIGDVWVMSGQSNMAFALQGVLENDIESAQGNLPLLRFFSLSTNEQPSPQDDIPAEKIETQGWAVSTPETALKFSAIGYAFASRLQRSLGIPIGVIKNSRGGASLEAIVPSHKFDEHPLAKRYADHVKQRIAAFDREATSLQMWNNQLARAKSKKVPEKDWPKKPVNGDNLTSWNVPGHSPSDMGSIHHGMFGVFKGYNIKGVLFHQGFNNTIGSNCRPKLYRVLMKLMVEGWREDFNDPTLPVAVISGCGGDDSQNAENFEIRAIGGAPYIYEAQRLGLADVGDPENTAFLPSYDIQIPGLHPTKKREHGERAARWALNRIYKQKVDWENAQLVSAKPQGDVMVLTFDKSIMPDDWSALIEGFSIAGDDGKFYMAHARFPLKSAGRSDSNARARDTTTIRVWSPLVKDPKAVRYAWGICPLGNLKVGGKAWLPLQSFRTDTFDYPEIEDPAAIAPMDSKKLKEDAVAQVLERRTKEGAMTPQVIEKLEALCAPSLP
jgi:sialate O-acetylesterase